MSRRHRREVAAEAADALAPTTIVADNAQVTLVAVAFSATGLTRAQVEVATARFFELIPENLVHTVGDVHDAFMAAGEYAASLTEGAGQ